MTVTFDADVLRYKNKAAHPAASTYRAGVVTAAAIRDADWGAFPPEVRTHTGETLFVPRSQRTDLEHFCHRNRIAQQRRPPIWSMLLEPFLDTVVSENTLAKIQIRLSQTGFEASEVAAIRNRVGPVMVSFNNKVWEWVDLGLDDLLRAASSSLVPKRLCAELGDPSEFYWWAMRIADRTPPEPV